MKGVIILLFILFIPLAYPLSIGDLLSRYSFSTATVQMNITRHTDFMADSNSNGISDKLIFELTTDNTAGTFIFLIDLFDQDGILTNETSRNLSAGTNKLNITFSSILLSQGQFNYSIKIYNGSRKLKYRKDNILTGIYPDYEGGFRIISVNDLKINRTLQLNVTASSPENKSHVTTLFLTYNNLTIFSKGTKPYKTPTTSLIFNFDNETIKKTHFIGNFTVSSIKIGRKTVKSGFSTKSYDFREFAAASYIYNFTDEGIDTGGGNKAEFLEINATLQILRANNYTITSALYDLTGSLIEMKNISSSLDIGKNAFAIRFNGSALYEKKLNGPYLLKNIELYENGTLTDKINDAYATGNYNFNDFDAGSLPDITVNISVSGAHHHGIENLTANFTFSNRGSGHAFNVGTDIFDNKTFSRSNKSGILHANSKITYEINFTGISDFEISAFADLQNTVEELNESNNAGRIVVKLNKKPFLGIVKNITANETDKIIVNLSASDPNEDDISFSVNLTKFSKSLNVFEWNTTVADSGHYALAAAASDGFLNDSAAFSIIVLDMPEKDTDNDGIEDGIDRLIGNDGSVNTSTIAFSMMVNDSKNISRLFDGIFPVKLMDGNLTIAEFDFNFSLYRLNLSNITIDKQQNGAAGSLLVKGVKIPEWATKTIYIDKVDAVNGVCIKEKEISSVADISSGCNSADEFLAECDGTLQEGHSCAYNTSIGKYRIKGMKHSGVIQFDYARPGPGTSSGAASISGSSGGGSGTACTSEWKCSEWSGCINGFKARKCRDSSQCAFPTKKPEEKQGCIGQIRILKAPNDGGITRKASPGTKSKISQLITGHSVGAPSRKQTGVFTAFAEVILIVGSYLLITKFPKMFK
ncbi:hypothetical protein HYX08_02615 [Candidatus Woesearchaeota archaeon]|nr:hypothetical protein [Candidatus Woesearchaeota archaeon]